METFLTVTHVIGSIVLVAIVLLQSGKGEGIGAGLGGASAAAQKMFGGGNTQTALGKATIGVAAVYMISSIALAYLSSNPDSAMDLNAGDANFGSQRGTVVEVGGNGQENSGSSDDSAKPAPGGEESSDDSAKPAPSGEESSDDSAKPAPSGEETSDSTESAETPPSESEGAAAGEATDESAAGSSDSDASNE